MKAIHAALALALTSSLSSGCFLLISSGIQPDIPAGAQAVGRPLVGEERVILAWDGSFAQDGGLLVLVTETRIIRHDDGGDRVVRLEDVSGIIVDEDEGRVVVQSADGLMAVPMRSAGERLELARVLQRAVQQRKLGLSADSPTTTTTTTTTTELAPSPAPERAPSPTPSPEGAPAVAPSPTPSPEGEGAPELAPSTKEAPAVAPSPTPSPEGPEGEGAPESRSRR